MKRALGYIRVSREEQAGNGTISMDAQRARIEAACEYKGFQLVGVCEDPGATGANGNRPGYQELLRRLDAGEAEAVVVFKLDRLTRSLRDLLNLFGEGGEYSGQGVAFVSASEEFDTATPSGRMMMQVLGTMAEFERATISERQRAAYKYRHEELGEYRGKIPYGWRVPEGGSHKLPETWEEAAEEQEAIRKIRQLALHQSHRAIAEAMNEAGIPSPAGGRWGRSSVQRILRRERRRGNDS